MFITIKTLATEKWPDEDPQVFAHPLSTGSCAPAGPVFLMSPICAYSPDCLQGMEHFPYKDRLRELGLEKSLGVLIAAFQYLRQAYRKAGKDFLERQVVT